MDADAAAADHGHGAARLNAGGVQHRAQAGGRAAADERQLREGNVVVHLDQRVLVDQHLGCVGTQLGELRDGLAVLAQPGRVVAPARYRRPVAQVGLAPGAEFASPAEHREARDHRVAGPDVADLLAHRFHDSGGLVSQDAGHGGGV